MNMNCHSKCEHGKCQGKNEIDTVNLYDKRFNLDTDCDLCPDMCPKCSIERDIDREM